MQKLPNRLTILRIVLAGAIAAVYFVGFPGWNYWAAGIFILAGITDILDGIIARRYNVVSDFGKLMDPMADKLLMLVCVLILLEWKKAELWVVLVILAREFIISAFRLVAAGKGKVIAAGITGKLKTLAQDIAIGVIFIFPAGVMFIVGTVILYVSCALAVASCVIYICRNINVLKKDI